MLSPAHTHIRLVQRCGHGVDVCLHGGGGLVATWRVCGSLRHGLSGGEKDVRFWALGGVCRTEWKPRTRVSKHRTRQRWAAMIISATNVRKWVNRATLSYNRPARPRSHSHAAHKAGRESALPQCCCAAYMRAGDAQCGQLALIGCTVSSVCEFFIDVGTNKCHFVCVHNGWLSRFKVGRTPSRQTTRNR